MDPRPESYEAEGDEAEGDEAATARQAVEDNSLGRLLALSDGVFAIATTLLVLDLKVPELPDGATNDQLVHALNGEIGSFATYLLSFYVVATYWSHHRRIMRSVVAVHPRLIGHTLLLLLLVAALPYPSSLLAEHGSLPIALTVYGGFNVVASLLLLWLRHDVHAYDLTTGQVDPEGWTEGGWQIRGNTVVFAIVAVAGYVLGREGPWALTLLAVSRVIVSLAARRRGRRA